MGRKGQEGRWSELEGLQGRLARVPMVGRGSGHQVMLYSPSVSGLPGPQGSLHEKRESPCGEYVVLHMFRELNKRGGAVLAPSRATYEAPEAPRGESCDKSPSQARVRGTRTPSQDTLAPHPVPSS